MKDLEERWATSRSAMGGDICARSTMRRGSTSSSDGNGAASQASNASYASNATQAPAPPDDDLATWSINFRSYGDKVPCGCKVPGGDAHEPYMMKNRMEERELD
eukprot:13395806-Heterocapsa_arctica.AAC.1